MNQLDKYPAKTTAIVITTAMLSFVSYWRAASVILCDLGSSAFYACGIAEQAIGEAAPYFVIAIMCFALCVRMVYMESCTMFVRGGVYKVVKQALGGTIGKISVSALLFDYSLTGPISGVSAGHYICGFLNQFFGLMNIDIVIPRNTFSVIFAFLAILYFWRKNIIGVGESSKKSLRIVQLSIIVMSTLFIWSVITIIINKPAMPTILPAPTDEALGWLGGFSWSRGIGLIGIFVALGHSLLAMSGEESLAQLYRELAHPKVKNLKRAAVIIFGFSLLVTGVLSLFAVMLIPDGVRPQYYDNLLSGLSMHLAGPLTAKLIFQGCVVVVGGLLLTGAINTSLVGANGDLNRLGEDGVLAEWFRKPHPKYGTTNRFLTSLVVIQLVIVLLCRGDVYLLGEAYAFGVAWCFVSQTAAVMILRWRDKTKRDFMVPLNIKIGKVYFPVGILLTFLMLLGMAIVNLFTKTIATKAGLFFTFAFFLLLQTCEYWNNRKAKKDDHGLEMVNLKFHDTATASACGCKHEKRILIAARDPNNLYHLKHLLDTGNLHNIDFLVMTVKSRQPNEEKPSEDISLDERRMLTNVVAIAEKYGVKVIPIMVPALDPMYAIAKAAYDLGASEIVLGKSPKIDPEVQLEGIAIAWGYVSANDPRKVMMRVIWPEHEMKFEIS